MQSSIRSEIRYISLIKLGLGGGGSAPLTLADEPNVSAGALSFLQDKYGLSEAQAIDRLAAEDEAASIYPSLREFLGESYAGAWFDADRLKLVVATIDEEMHPYIRSVGGHPQAAERSLQTLEGITDQLASEAGENSDWRAAVTGWYIDYPTNSVVMEVLPEAQGNVRTRLSAMELTESQVRIRDSAGHPPLAWDVRGAERYCNEDLSIDCSQPGQAWECSIGFPVDGGYLTAGHCGSPMEEVSGFNDQSQGTFEESGWSDNDRGLVLTNVNWVSKPEINGYNDGTISVPAEGAGYMEAPVSSTVCRYGQTTGGPYCGEILAKNQSQSFSQPSGPSVTLHGITKVDTCADGGDSGGPYISASSHQAQGTLIGGWHCSDPQVGTWFEPVIGTLEEFDSIMLTTHGTNAPDITLFSCPAVGSGMGIYNCIVQFDSQGLTPIDWTSNTSDSSETHRLIGTCSEHQWVTVDVEVENPYGTDDRQAGFTCPSGPID